MENGIECVKVYYCYYRDGRSITEGRYFWNTRYAARKLFYEYGNSDFELITIFPVKVSCKSGIRMVDGEVLPGSPDCPLELVKLDLCNGRV